jgi:hypothetical protein
LRVKNDDCHKIDVPLTVQCDPVFYIMLAYKDREEAWMTRWKEER